MEAECISRSNFRPILQHIEESEDKIKNTLWHFLNKPCQLDTKATLIARTMATIGTVQNNTKLLNSQIYHTISLTESISSKVRRLDVARSRVFECQQRVHDLIDLHFCSKGVLTAISEKDYEACAVHINRFLAMDLHLLTRTANDVQGSLSSVGEAVHTLELATTNVRGLILSQFDEAVKEDDLPLIERLFKIFPLISLHSEGIMRFSDYVCIKLALKAQKELRNAVETAKTKKNSNIAYVDTFTTLLENFARVIEVNQPIIETCYGAGYMIDFVLILQKQCDKEVQNIILEFKNSCKIATHVNSLNECMRTLKPHMTNGDEKQSFCHNKSSGRICNKQNLIDIDAIIDAIIAMHSRAELYCRFIKRRVTADIAESTLNKTILQTKMEEFNKLLYQCDLSLQMQELLGIYILFERFLIKESVVKAIALDCCENGQQCSSVVDDVFFIIRKSIRRALSSLSVNGTCAIINNAASCLDCEFVNALRLPLKAVQIDLQSGKFQLNDYEKECINFLIYLNNADMSIEYIETLSETLEHDIKNTFPIMNIMEREIINSAIAELKTVRDSLKGCVDFGMQQLRICVIKPQLKQWMEYFQNYKHHLTEEEFEAYIAGETFAQFLVIQLDRFLNFFKHRLNSRNYDMLVTLLAIDVSAYLEGAIKKCTFNRLGGLMLDNDVRALNAYFVNAASCTIRDKMIRLNQITTILNLESIFELTDYWAPQNIAELPSVRLSSRDVRTFLLLRTDFCVEDVKRIRL